MFKFEKLEKSLNENYVLNSGNSLNSEIVKQNIGKLFKLRNDLVFLHISVKGSNFNELHSLLNEYYKHLDDVIDSLLELYVGIFKKSFNLNEFKFSDTNSDNSIFRIKKILGEILSVLDKIKTEFSKLENDAINSQIDGIAEYYFKQYTFIIDGFLGDIREDEGGVSAGGDCADCADCVDCASASNGTSSGDIATVDNRFPEIVKRKKFRENFKKIRKNFKIC